MLVIVKEPDDKYLSARDYRAFLRIEIDGKECFNVSDGEPEDANLRRDFNACLFIPELMQKAYEAGKNGEEFNVEWKSISEEED